MPPEGPNPARIMQLATGYWNSAAFLAANELNLFGALADRPLPAAEIARRLDTAPRSTAMLLDACVGLGLLLKEVSNGDTVYRNAPDAVAFLVPGHPGYLGGAIRWGADQYSAWADLAASVRDDAPAVPPSLHLGDDPEKTRAFVLGMRSRALGMARGLLHFLDFADATTLLDVGGGPATYAELLARKYPSLQVTVLDLPPVLAVARELLDGSDVAERISLIPGNATTDDYGTSRYDAVLFSGVLHQMGPGTIRRMLGKAHRSLKPGGRIVISDMMLDGSKTEPSFAALFSLQMLLTTEEGAVFSTEECAGWLAEAGFSDVAVQPLPPPLPYTLIAARTGQER